MAIIREKQEMANSIYDLIEEIKDDMDKLEYLGIYPVHEIYCIHQKLDDIAKVVRTALTLDLTNPVKKT